MHGAPSGGGGSGSASGGGSIVTCIDYSTRHEHLLLCCLVPRRGVFREGQIGIMRVGADQRMGLQSLSVDRIAQCDNRVSAGRCVWSERYAGWAMVANSDGTVGLWDMNRVQLQKEQEEDAKLKATDAARCSVRVLVEDGHAVTSCSWNNLLPELVVAGSASSRARLFDVNKLQHVVGTFAEHGRPINDLRWNNNNPDEFATVSTDGMMKIWDRRTKGNSVSTLFDRQATPSTEPHALRCCDWHKRDDWLIAVGNAADQVLVWDIRNTLQPLKRRSAHRGSVSSVKFDTKHTGRLATCSTGDNTVRVWDTSGDGIYLTHEHKIHRRGVTHVDWDIHRDDVITSCGMDGVIICKPLDKITHVNEQYREGRLVTTKSAPRTRSPTVSSNDNHPVSKM